MESKRAFTLIELAIVLVVIGLITAGILAGKNILQAAKIRVTASEILKYKMAFTSFYSQYDAIPGDMQNATSYWSTTGNGDGDRFVESGISESAYAWAHLTNAGLISASLSGTGTTATVGVNAPTSAILDGAGYQILSQWGNVSIYGKGSTVNEIRIGKNAGGDLNVPAISAQNAYALDLKIDDGLASLGKMVSYYLSGPGSCATGSYSGAAGSSNYVLTDATISCSVAIWLDK